MTETELNKKLEELRNELPTQFPVCNRKTGSAYRRYAGFMKNERLYQILQYSYIPHAGFTKNFYDGPQITHSGSYIRYPKNSNRQKHYKRYSNKLVRRHMDLPPKGNAYQRVFDYWWVLY